ncbi:hypothetical protein ABZX95_40155 [Streptomyces sp. NPDC004232]|uniref:hypothetical protein n=1 Tax=Streptomyces sp. NPDC004232 TaxID=3154454 RepID=UPI0033A620BC
MEEYEKREIAAIGHEARMRRASQTVFTKTASVDDDTLSPLIQVIEAAGWHLEHVTAYARSTDLPRVLLVFRAK